MRVVSMESLPLGFRFRPTDEELINHYLRLKINGRDSEGSFVLCRLFRKSDEKNDVVKYDEVDRTSSPNTNRSSPDDTSSDLVQENNIRDDAITNDVVPVESCGNSHMTSDVEDHSAEGTTIEDYLLPGENPSHYELSNGQIDPKLFSPMQLNIHDELAAYMDLPYASDFGNDHHGLHFQDGTGEKDVLFTDILDDVLNNQDEYSSVESASQKDVVVGRDLQLPGEILMPQEVPQENIYVKDNNGTCRDRDTEMAQAQGDMVMGASRWFNEQGDSTETLQTPAYFAVYDRQLRKGDIGVYGDNSVMQGASSADSAVDSFYDNLISFEMSSTLKNPVNHTGDSASGTGIKIRTRQPQNRSTMDNFAIQGTAPRRIRLQMTPPPKPVGNVEEKDVNHHEEEDEVQSALTEVDEAKEKIHISDDVDGESEQLKFDKSRNNITEESSPKLRLRVKRDGESVNPKMESSESSVADSSPKLKSRVKCDGESCNLKEEESNSSRAPPPALGSRRTSIIYSLSIFLMMIVFIIFTWNALRKHRYLLFTL
ncbi:hypothetical protein EZV62_023326 [Acer yangbiense]|uniref:NAC domain-containing protein n=1 Tax=Acer yangbiense TaxID=1000413 RepID=A0A5C7H2W0_9ROSI|nr:hypothetical protein EZV62_023326 [Acer yangbiense]